MSLYENINKRKKAGTSRSKSKSTISPEYFQIEDVEDDNISAKVSCVDGKNMAKVKLSFNSEPPPEGISKIRDELNKVLP